MKLEEAVRSGRQFKRAGMRYFYISEVQRSPNDPMSITFGDAIADDWEIEPDPQPPLPQKAREWLSVVCGQGHLHQDPEHPFQRGCSLRLETIRVREILPDEEKFGQVEEWHGWPDKKTTGQWAGDRGCEDMPHYGKYRTVRYREVLP